MENKEQLTAITRDGSRWKRSKQAERDAMATLYATITAAAASGITETDIARAAGVDRMTVRRALGKRPNKEEPMTITDLANATADKFSPALSTPRADDITLELRVLYGTALDAVSVPAVIAKRYLADGFLRVRKLHNGPGGINRQDAGKEMS